MFLNDSLDLQNIGEGLFAESKIHSRQPIGHFFGTKRKYQDILSMPPHKSDYAIHIDDDHILDCYEVANNPDSKH